MNYDKHFWTDCGDFNVVGTLPGQQTDYTTIRRGTAEPKTSIGHALQHGSQNIINEPIVSIKQDTNTFTSRQAWNNETVE